MYPYIEIFGISYATYGLMAMLGCFVAFAFILYICPRYGALRLNELYLIALCRDLCRCGRKASLCCG